MKMMTKYRIVVKQDSFGQLKYQPQERAFGFIWFNSSTIAYPSEERALNFIKATATKTKVVDIIEVD